MEGVEFASIIWEGRSGRDSDDRVAEHLADTKLLDVKNDNAIKLKLVVNDDVRFR